MSTQQAPVIDFSVASQFTNFQLVELPDELLTIIANHKDETPVLQLKSEARSGNAVLCSSNATFPLRSVQTSNSLFVVRPASTSHESNDDTIPQQGVRAIASCGVTLELSKSTECAAPYLRKALPVYTSRDLIASAAMKATWSSILSSVPLSDGETEDAWVDLCAFEEQGASYRPSAHVLLEIWTAISRASTADGISLASAFIVEDLWISIRDEEFPRSLFDAVLRRVEDRDSMDVDTGTKWCSIDKVRCAQWTGALILETRTLAGGSMAVSDFMDTWKGHVPEQWRGDLEMDLLEKLVTQPSSSTIALKPEHRLAGPQSSTASVAETAAPAAKKGKWHEKFKKTRA